MWFLIMICTLRSLEENVDQVCVRIIIQYIVASLLIVQSNLTIFYISFKDYNSRNIYPIYLEFGIRIPLTT